MFAKPLTPEKTTLVAELPRSASSTAAQLRPVVSSDSTDPTDASDYASAPSKASSPTLSFDSTGLRTPPPPPVVHVLPGPNPYAQLCVHRSEDGITPNRLFAVMVDKETSDSPTKQFKALVVEQAEAEQDAESVSSAKHSIGAEFWADFGWDEILPISSVGSSLSSSSSWVDRQPQEVLWVDPDWMKNESTGASWLLGGDGASDGTSAKPYLSTTKSQSDEDTACGRFFRGIFRPKPRSHESSLAFKEAHDDSLATASYTAL